MKALMRGLLLVTCALPALLGTIAYASGCREAWGGEQPGFLGAILLFGLWGVLLAELSAQLWLKSYGVVIALAALLWKAGRLKPLIYVGASAVWLTGLMAMQVSRGVEFVRCGDLYYPVVYNATALFVIVLWAVAQALHGSQRSGQGTERGAGTIRTRVPSIERGVHWVIGGTGGALLLVVVGALILGTATSKASKESHQAARETMRVIRTCLADYANKHPDRGYPVDLDALGPAGSRCLRDEASELAGAYRVAYLLTVPDAGNVVRM